MDFTQALPGRWEWAVCDGNTDVVGIRLDCHKSAPFLRADMSSSSSEEWWCAACPIQRGISTTAVYLFVLNGGLIDCGIPTSGLFNTNDRHTIFVSEYFLFT